MEIHASLRLLDDARTSARSRQFVTMMSLCSLIVGCSSSDNSARVPEPASSAVATPSISVVVPATEAPTTVSPTTVAPTTVAPTTVAPTTVAPTTTIPRPKPTEIPNSTLAGDVAFLGPIYTLSVGNLTIAYRQFGSGPDLLMIAGQASPMSLWPASTLAALAERSRITIYDNRDLGNTTDTVTPFALSDLADDAAGLINALGLDHPHVFGWSTGGEVGLLLAVRHPEVLSSLAITGATPGGRNSVLPSPEMIECFGSEVPLCDPLPWLFSSSPAGIDGKNRFIADYVKVPQEPSVPGTATKYDQAEKSYWSDDEPDLAAITVPVLVMNGQEDPIVPPANATYIADRIGDNAQLQIDPGGLHGWFIEHPDRFFELMTTFLG